MSGETVVLKGLRRDMTKEMFEELVSLQCAAEEILGYVGTTERKLAAWCRKTYRRPLEEMISMIRQDGLVAIRRASFDQLKKSATIISQQYNRFLPNAAAEARMGAETALRSLTAAVMPADEEMRSLFDDPAGDPS
jgi:hypothetical protein